MLLATYQGGAGVAIASKRYPHRAICGLEWCPKMKYPEGQEVKLGDVVALGTDQRGVVVCSIDTREYSESYPRAQWGYLDSGVLIEFPSHGLIHYKEPESNLRLVARAAGRAAIGLGVTAS